MHVLIVVYFFISNLAGRLADANPRNLTDKEILSALENVSEAAWLIPIHFFAWRLEWCQVLDLPSMAS
jgi:hypothetical protein